MFAPPTPDGWYPDPGDPIALRYWQGNAWTTWVSNFGRPRHQPLPTRTAVAPMVALPPRALWWALGGFVLTIVLAAAAALASDSLTVSLALGIVAIDVGLVGTAWLITKRYGTGSLADDLGLRFSRHDSAGGLATGVSARALAGAAAIVVLALTRGDIDNTDIQFDVFRDLLAPIPDGVEFRTTLRGRADVIVFFTRSRAKLERRVAIAGRAIFPNGGLWIAWPKRASKIDTDMTEDVVRDVALPLGLVDNKVCAIDDTWSGLRIVWRRELRS